MTIIIPMPYNTVYYKVIKNKLNINHTHDTLINTVILIYTYLTSFPFSYSDFH